jgi:hypothetical protein
MPRGKYIRSQEWRERARERNTGNLNPSFKHGSYSQKRISALQTKEKIINDTYLNKEWLFQKYCTGETPIQIIADNCKVKFETIWDSLRELGIPRISMVGRKYWHEWVESEKVKKAKQDKDYKQLMEDDQDKIKGNVATAKIDRYKTLVYQQTQREKNTG